MSDAVPKEYENALKDCLEFIGERGHHQPGAALLLCIDQVVDTGASQLLQAMHPALEDEGRQVAYIPWQEWQEAYHTADAVRLATEKQFGQAEVLLIEQVPWMVYGRKALAFGKWLHAKQRRGAVIVYAATRGWPLWGWPREGAFPSEARKQQEVPLLESPAKPPPNVNVPKVPRELWRAWKEAKDWQKALETYLCFWDTWERRLPPKPPKPLSERLRCLCAQYGSSDTNWEEVRVSAWAWPVPWLAGDGPSVSFHEVLRPWLGWLCQEKARWQRVIQVLQGGCS